MPAPPYTMEMLGRDVLAIMDGLGIKKANWCGLSMGGMVGQWLGANAPERFDKLVLCNTACYYADKSAWADRINAVKTDGIGAVAAGVANRWFTPGFIAREPDKVERLRQMVRETSLDGYLGCCEAIRDMDHRALLPKITAPTLIIAGKPRRRDYARGCRIHPRAYSRREASAARCRAYFQCRAGEKIHGGSVGVLEAGPNVIS